MHMQTPLRLALSSFASAFMCAAALAGSFSVSGPGAPIPDFTSGTWNTSYTGGAFTSSVSLSASVVAVTRVRLFGLAHTQRGDLQILLRNPAGNLFTVISRPGWNGTGVGDTGDYLAGTYDIVDTSGGNVAQGAANIGGAPYNVFLGTAGGTWTGPGITNGTLAAITGSAGTWTLEIRDWSLGETGALTGWTLEGLDALVYTEAFDYGPLSGSLVGQNGGTGFASAWVQGNPGIVYDAVGLSFGNLVATGGKAFATGTSSIGNSTDQRTLSATLTGTFYGSYLTQAQYSNQLIDILVGHVIPLTMGISSPEQEAGFSFFTPNHLGNALGVRAQVAATGTCSASSTPVLNGGPLNQAQTYLTLFKFDTTTRTGTAWLLNRDQFNVVKSGGISEAELNAPTLGSASNQIVARVTKTDTHSCTITPTALAIYMNEFSGVTASLSLDELRLAQSGFDDVTPLQPWTSFCTGDAVGTTCVACGNNGVAGRGCANSVYSAGALLTFSGTASIGSDTLVLTCSDMQGPALFFQADGLAAAPVGFGDGMLCATVGIIRMGVVFPVADVASYPGGLTPLAIHLAGAPISAASVKHYQCWYRDSPAFCTAATFNTSNGISLAWIP
jgi:hypothetical protein